MVADRFSHVTTWVFDLDNTLYPVSARLFDQINVRMTAWVMNELGVDRERADYLRDHYWRSYGTTLAGLMDEHGVDPGPYLSHVHEIDFTVLDTDPDLRAAITDLPGRKIIFTNGTAPYAEQVIEARGLTGLFDAIYGVEHANFRPKPERVAFEKVFTTDGVTPETAAMFEDDERNLQVPHEMGMKCTLVGPEPHNAPHIHHHTNDLSGFLSQLVK